MKIQILMDFGIWRHCFWRIFDKMYLRVQKELVVQISLSKVTWKDFLFFGLVKFAERYDTDRIGYEYAASHRCLEPWEFLSRQTTLMSDIAGRKSLQLLPIQIIQIKQCANTSQDSQHPPKFEKHLLFQFLVTKCIRAMQQVICWIVLDWSRLVLSKRFWFLSTRNNDRNPRNIDRHCPTSFSKWMLPLFSVHESFTQ